MGACNFIENPGVSYSRFYMPEPAQFRSAHLKINLYRNRVEDRCQLHIANSTLCPAIFSFSKSEIPLRSQPYTGINLYVQAEQKTLSKCKLGKLFGANVQVVSYGNATKNDSWKICSGFCKNSSLFQILTQIKLSMIFWFRIILCANSSSGLGAVLPAHEVCSEFVQGLSQCLC